MVMRAETEAAIRAVRIAQQIADSRDGAGAITSKGGIDLVTAADVACEDAIRVELGRAFPEYPVVGEERAGTPVEGKPYWLVDPICGTRHYASDIPLYCVNIALVEDGVVTTAAVGFGMTGQIVFAEKGHGAWSRTATGDRRSAASAGSNAIWIDGKTERAANIARNATLMKRWYVWQFSSTLSYAYVATGRISGILHFCNPSPPPYGSVHISAGCLIAAESGAIVVDADTGTPWNLQTRSLMLAATPELARDLLDLARS
jgi:myo-inositol-1(or 4)-monophosphatase